MPKVYVDLDGVLADFQRHFDKTIDNGGLSRNKFDDYEEKIVNTKDWWLKMPVLGDAKELVSHLVAAGVDIHILSAAPEWHADAARQKTEWIHKHFKIKNKNIHIVRRVDKKYFAKEGDILIDDFNRNTKEWHAAGGSSILHKKAMYTIAELEKLGVTKT